MDMDGINYGVRTIENSIGYPIIHCGSCGAPVIWCWDSICDELEDDGMTDFPTIYRRQADFQPVAKGDIILWYRVNEFNLPVSIQFFTRIGEMIVNYSGPQWSFHASTCRGRK